MNEKKLEALITDAMWVLERMPQGGVGENGATREEIIEANIRGEPVWEDASYDCAQRAWHFLEEALKELRKPKP